jgi:ferredoxin-NADP reductase
MGVVASRSLLRRSLAIGVVAACLGPSGASAQDAPADHSAHHPGGTSTPTPPTMPASPTAPAPGGPGAAPPVSGMMMGMEMMGGPPPRQLYPTLMSMPGLGTTERQAIADEAHARMSRGLPLILDGGEEAMRGFSAGDAVAMRDAGERVRLGLSLFESGLSTHLALGAGQSPQGIALDWFKGQLGLPQVSPALGPPGSDGLGFTPTHLATMTVLTLSAASLLALQFLRMRRVRLILQRTAQPPRPAVAGPILSPPLPSAPAFTPAAAPVPPLPSVPAAALPPDTVVPPRETAPRRAWSGVLRVAQVARETPSIKTFRLVEPSGAPLPFDYLPGQFMNVEVEPTPGAVLKRAYTIASSPTRQAYAELTIKREAQGKVSQFLHDGVTAGDLLKVSAPYGAFTFTGMDEDSIVLIGGGVGITPLMSVLRYLTDRAWPGEIYFLYSARSTEEFVFRDELAYLQRRHPNLHVLATMTRSEGTDWMGPEGQLTKELLQVTVPELQKRRIHICGPPPMMAAMKEALTALGVPAEKIHTEAFGPASLPADRLPPAPPTPAEAARLAATRPGTTPVKALVVPVTAPNTITFARSGKSAALPAGTTVLEAAEAAGVDIPWSCRIGISGTCKVRLLQGSVTMAVEEGLPPEDKAAGFILACQAKSVGGNLVVDA